jgi:nicotinamide phosphoribosyltransferase
MVKHPVALKDFYKVDHRRQYPDGTELVFTNFTARKSRIPGINHMVLFGLQYFVKKYLMADWDENFFNRPKGEVLAKYRRRIDNALGAGTVPIDHLEQLHDHGSLPICIMALPEGSVVPVGVPPLVIYNTESWAFWLPNYLETILSCVIWQPSTNATIAYEYRKMFRQFAAETGCDPELTQFQGHDFSFRGMPGLEAAMMSGAAHLLSFVGTDTIPAIDFLEKYYGADSDKELVGCSVPATEHSVMSMGTQEGEIETFRRLLALYPTGILSVVSDTWDYWKVLTEILPVLKQEIMGREGKLVVRPDSSPKTPLEILVGDYDATPGSPEYKGTVEVLWDLFGGTRNDLGFKVLDEHIGTIYGDSITLDLARKINQALMDKGFASINWVAGIGSFTYQYNTRDTFGSAMKATFGVVNGQDREIFKDPATDTGAKKSAKGLISVHRNAQGEFYKIEQTGWSDVLNCAFEVVFSDGQLMRDENLAEIRQRLAST